jgi:FtsP/CotA-like multicopper oxidase with cupredoxin domain
MKPQQENASDRLPSLDENVRISRRMVLKTAAVGAGAAVIGGVSLRSASAATFVSPTTRPFIEPLPVYSPKAPVNVSSLVPAPAKLPVAGECARDAHQAWDACPPQKYYELDVRESQHSFHRDLPTSRIWGYDGIYPGPTFYARYGEPVSLRVKNNLPKNHVGPGIPQISLHLHNLHTPSESDGNPLDFFDSGTFRDLHYPNQYAGLNIAPGGDPREALGTLWYHDHRFDFTAANVYHGLAGFYLLFDPLDSGNETDESPGALRLPSGKYDIPLLFQDKSFQANGALYYDVFNTDGFLGDKYVVNGKIQPYFQVARRKYRFRMLNGGPARFYQFALSSGLPMVVVGVDGNLLPAPVEVKNLMIVPAERMDVIIDFSKYQIGQSVFLNNILEQTDGRGPKGFLKKPQNIMRFDVVSDAADPSVVPKALRPLPPINLNEVVKNRLFDLGRSNGSWVINGELYDPNVFAAEIKANTAEIWTLRNSSGGWHHPMHLHFEEGRIISRNGAAPRPLEVGRKDVFNVGPNEEVKVFVRFRDFLGKYVMHCHNLSHEDHAMMINWRIIP